jgi:hypothetical protein
VPGYTSPGFPDPGNSPTPSANDRRSSPLGTGAKNGSQRVQPSSDPARRSQILLAGQRLPVRLSPTVTDTMEFPDTEEVTGSNPVRPTIFENLSLRREPKGEPAAEGRGPPAAGMSFSKGETAVVTSAVRCRQLFQSDDPLLMPDDLQALFSQVNNGLRDVFPSSHGAQSFLQDSVS